MQKAFYKLAILFLAVGLTACTDYMSSFPHIPGFGSGSTNNNAQLPVAKNGMVGTTVDQSTGQAVPVAVNMSGGEAIGLKSMDELDKSKMSHALDGAPGKATTWQNASSGITYTVTPTRKVVISGNPFCREYQVKIARGSNSRDVTATACVTTDGSWHTI